MIEDDCQEDFDPETESIFCSRCGSRLEKSGHMFNEFMLCPKHGEFTLAPIIIREPTTAIDESPLFGVIPNPSPRAGKWTMEADCTTISMWRACKTIDQRHADGSPYDPRETRVM